MIENLARVVVARNSLIAMERIQLKDKIVFVGLQGVEPWSKHIRRKLSTCLLLHEL